MNEQRTAYGSIRKKSSRRSRVAGILSIVFVYGIAIPLLSFNGLNYIYPPPEEKSILIDFSAEMEEIKTEQGRQPRSEEVDLEKPVELVQKSESPVEAPVPNQAPASEPDNFGDVDVPAPEPEKPVINQKALFPGMGKKPADSSSPHSASSATPTFKAGQSDGNAKNSATIEGRSNAHLQGREVVGGLVKPDYQVQEKGIVVVQIWVDIYGNVVNATPGMPGTTVTDKKLWTEARNAAMRTHFTKLDKITNETPERQEGTITYIFELK
jgi:colicin import membrane protein